MPVEERGRICQGECVVTKKRGQSADFRHPRSNTDVTHTDYSHISCSSYASDSQNTAHTIATKCVDLFTSYAQHNTHSRAHQQQHGSLLQLPGFSGSTLLDLSDLVNVIAHLQSNLPDSPSLLLFAVQLLRSGKFYQLSSKKNNPFLLWLFSFSPGFLQCLPPYAPKPTNFLTTQPIQTITRRHHITSPQSIKSSRHAKRSHQRLHTSLTVLPMQA